MYLKAFIFKFYIRFIMFASVHKVKLEHELQDMVTDHKGFLSQDLHFLSVCVCVCVCVCVFQ